MEKQLAVSILETDWPLPALVSSPVPASAASAASAQYGTSNARQASEEKKKKKELRHPDWKGRSS